jgi:hypothetical protein
MLDIVEGSAPSKLERETAGRAGAGNVEAPAHNDTERKKKKENNNVEGIGRTVSGCCSRRAPSRREHIVVRAKNNKRKHRAQKNTLQT